MSGAARKITKETAEEMILDILKEGGPMTTIQIEEVFRLHKAECPDSAALFLNKMRLGGKINGELSIEHKGWLWWMD
ncbi:MAG: hypothetical protein KAW39_00815 [Thermoplasmata archaeon]|nr:hypothetical protein [Thermoplasmata archaeon]